MRTAKELEMLRKQAGHDFLDHKIKSWELKKIWNDIDDELSELRRKGKKK